MYYFFPTSTGVKCYNKGKTASVFIDESGRKHVSCAKAKNSIIYSKIPFFRGFSYLILGICALFSAFSFTIKNQLEDAEIKIGKKVKVRWANVGLTIVGVISIVLAVLLFGLVPSKMSYIFIGKSYNIYLRNFIIAITKLVFFIIILLVLRFIPAMQDLYRFNGAGNCVIRNEGEIKNNKNLIWHNPLNFLNYLVFTFILAIFVITLVGISVNFWANWLINLAIFIGISMISYEFLWLISLTKMWKSCVITSFFIAMKPQTTHDEVCRIAYSQLNMSMKGEQLKSEQIALSTVLAEMQTKLSRANKYDKSDVEWIIATILNKNRAEAKLVRSFDEKTYREIMKATDRRAKGEPLSSIFGFVDFYGLRFDVNKKVLAPRMETELLVEEVIKISQSIKNCEILDIGSGSGAIAVSIAKNSKAKVTGVDVSKQALQVATNNAKKNAVKVEFIESNLFNSLKKGRKFDIIVSNPPYIPSKDIEKLSEEVKKYDPRLALDGGEDGLDFYRDIILEAPKHLKKDGILIFELGKGQFTSVKKLLEKRGFEDIKGLKDYNKIYRIIRAKYGKSK